MPARAIAGSLLMRVFVPLATMLAIGLIALAVLLTSWFIHPVLDLVGAPAVVGLTPSQAHDYSDRTVGELLFGPATFEFAAPDGTAFYTADERAHMRDVRLVLFAFVGLALAAKIGVGVIGLRRRWDSDFAQAVARGGLGLVVGTVVVGVFAAVAFEAAFELFHRLLFPGGNFNFDPASRRLVQLYPFAFWQLTAAALGALLIVGGGLTWLVARRRARAEAAR